MLVPASQVQQKEELVMTQFTKSFLAGTVIGMLMTTAAIGTAAAAGPENRVTILYDAFGKDASMRKDWGFSALVEIGGKRILFDTGDNSDIFAANVKAKNVDLINLDFVVLSHRHGDHMAGLTHVLTVNPKVKDLRSQGGLRHLRLVAAVELLSEGRSLAAGHALLRRQTTRDNELRFGLAGRQLRAYRQDNRNRPGHHLDRPCLGRYGHPGAQGIVACHRHAGWSCAGGRLLASRD